VPLSPSKEIASNSGFQSRLDGNISRHLESELKSSAVASNTQQVSAANAHEITSNSDSGTYFSVPNKHHQRL
jgi:hypothetical protein